VHEYERKQLLERIGREGATVGVELPETIDLDGEALDLRAFVFETKRLETVPADRREEVEAVKGKLRRERNRRVERLESEPLDYEDGEALAESIVGIDRALDALSALDPEDLEAEREAATAADQKRWMRFLRKALGQGGDAGDRRTRGGP